MMLNLKCINYKRKLWTQIRGEGCEAVSIGWEGVNLQGSESHGLLFTLTKGYVEFVGEKVLFRVHGVLRFLLISAHGYAKAKERWSCLKHLDTIWSQLTLREYT